jgi:hypothetical protein
VPRSSSTARTLLALGEKSSRDGFDAGNAEVRKYLDSLKDKRTARVTTLTESYAKAANATDFDVDTSGWTLPA